MWPISKREKDNFFDDLSKTEGESIVGRHKSSAPFQYDACSLGYLVTLLSISNRSWGIFSRGRAARSREARVEPKSQGRSVKTQQEGEEESNSNMGAIH